MEREHLQQGTQDLLEATKRFVESVSMYAWTQSDGEEVYRQVILRSILRKQFESLEAIVELASDDRGNVAVTLLRPMCEELIWTEYLRLISPQNSALLLLSMARVGIHETFCAQERYAAGKNMGDLGFPPGTAGQLRAASDAATEQLKLLAKTLNWPNRGKQLLPTVRFLARATNRLEMYNLLYHATSRVVHFSVPELLRRVWGEPGRMAVSSNFYQRYWADFSLYWGGWMYAQTFLTIPPILTGLESDLEDTEILAVDKAVRVLLSRGGIPILTIEEIAWPFSQT